MTVNVENVLLRLKKISCPYSGKKLSPEETKKMIEHLTIKSSKPTILSDFDNFDLKKFVNKLDEIIAKNPKDVELRKYRTYVEKLVEIKK